MAVSPDLVFQNLSTVHSDKQLTPKTIASAATLAIETFITFVSGTVQVATITPPVTGAHMITLIFTNAAPGAFLTTGNILTAYQPIQNRPITLFYDPTTAKYYVHSVA